MKRALNMIAGVLLALVLTLSPLVAQAASPVFRAYDLDPPYEGSVSVALVHEDVVDGARVRTELNGMQIDLYQVWTLSSMGEVVFAAPFDRAGKQITEEMTPREIQDLTPDFSPFIEQIEPFRSQTAAGGEVTFTDLPFGGYLAHQGNDLRIDGIIFYMSDFLVSVPFLDETTGKYVKDATKSMVTPKIHTEREKPDEPPCVKIAKQDLGGKEVDGAVLCIADPSGNVIKDKDGNELRWTTDISKEKVHEVVLEPGTYTLNEVSAPAGYFLARAILFTIDRDGNVAVLSDEGKVIPKDDQDWATLIMEDEALPDIGKKVNGVDHYDLKAEEEVFTYTLTTYVPRAAQESFKLFDTLEPVLEFEPGADGKTKPVDQLVKVVIGSGRELTAEEKNRTITIDENTRTLALNLTGDLLTEARQHDLELTFTAKIRKGANLSKYVNRRVPNDTSYLIDNKYSKRSKPVTVTPPPSIVKTGDDNPFLLYAIALSAAFLVILVVLLLRRRRKEDGPEETEES